jgi:acyl-CoA reductase-like NAD-dependent aldehyde dehydrogenase
VAAVVDRSGNMKEAARDLVKARFGFGGSAVHAPDLVLVNEFKIKEFSEAVADAGLRYLSQTLEVVTAERESRSKTVSNDKAAFAKHGTVLFSGSRGQVVLLRSDTSIALTEKLDSPMLLVLPVSSMDDAIDYLNKGDLPLATNYVYAAPAAAKYITQFVKSTSSFINHLPAELLIGGLGPSGWQLSAHPRYSPEMFSQPSPILINSSVRSSYITKLVTTSDSRQERQLEVSLTPSFTPVKEPFGPMFGFFEQGFLFNATLILSSVMIGTFCGIRYGFPVIMQSL